MDYKTLTHQRLNFGYTSQPIWLHFHNNTQSNRQSQTT
ncbi:MAG: 7TM-DISM domain-containing protein [Anaerolineae bacterium]